MLNWDEVMALLYDEGYVGRRSEFDALRGILSCLGSPQEKLHYVHVAGTNGKGSASRMMQEILTRAGYRTGLFISPHLQYMNERWTIDGEMISDEELRKEAERIRAAVDAYNKALRGKKDGKGEAVEGRDCTEWGKGMTTPAGEYSPKAQSWNFTKTELTASEREENDRQGRTCSADGRWTTVKGELPEDPPEERPVSFALLTMMAFDYFARKKCDIVVLEVGIGGRLDSTNVIPVPELAIIMNIGLEHTELLGHTLEEIAHEKGGIIKTGAEVVLYHQTQEVEDVIRRICLRKGARLTITDPEELIGPCDVSENEAIHDLPRMDSEGTEFSEEGRDSEPWKSLVRNQIRADVKDADLLQNSNGTSGSNAARMRNQCWTYRKHTNIPLNLAGQYQRYNMLAVLDGIDVLRCRGWRIPEKAIRDGLANVTWPGRFEILSWDPLVIVDGAHNPNGIEALVRNIGDLYGPTAGRRILFVVGIMSDKDVSEMLRLLSPHAAGFIMETAPSERAESAQELCAEAVRYYDGPVQAAPSMQAALEQALKCSDDDTAVICCGSLYQVADIREMMRTMFGEDTCSLS